MLWCIMLCNCISTVNFHCYVVTFFSHNIMCLGLLIIFWSVWDVVMMLWWIPLIVHWNLCVACWGNCVSLDMQVIFLTLTCLYIYVYVWVDMVRLSCISNILYFKHYMFWDFNEYIKFSMFLSDYFKLHAKSDN